MVSQNGSIPKVNEGKLIRDWARKISKYLNNYLEINGDGKWISVARKGTGWNIRLIGDLGSLIKEEWPFRPTKGKDDNANPTLVIQHGWIKPLGISSDCGSYTNQPTFEGAIWPSAGDATMPLPATGIYDILACIDIKAGTLDVETSAAERCLCACLRGVDVIVRDVTALPTSTPWKCGVSDPNNSANNVAAVDGKIYTCIGKIDIVNETDECSVKILNSGTKSNLFINCCNGEIELIGDGRAA